MEQLVIRLPQPLVQALSDGWIPAGDAAYGPSRRIDPDVRLPLLRRGKGRVHNLVHILEVPRRRVGAPAVVQQMRRQGAGFWKQGSPVQLVFQHRAERALVKTGHLLPPFGCAALVVAEHAAKEPRHRSQGAGPLVADGCRRPDHGGDLLRAGIGSVPLDEGPQLLGGHHRTRAGLGGRAYRCGRRRPRRAGQHHEKRQNAHVHIDHHFLTLTDFLELWFHPVQQFQEGGPPSGR